MPAGARGVHGESRIGDVVLYELDGTRCVGMLLANYRVADRQMSCAEVWTPSTSIETHSFLHKYTINSKVVEFLTEYLIISLTFCPPKGDSRMAFVIIPEDI